MTRFRGRADNGDVELTINKDDWNELLEVLGCACAAASAKGDLPAADRLFGLVNRLNQGNPDFWPYPLLREKEFNG